MPTPLTCGKLHRRQAPNKVVALHGEYKEEGRIVTSGFIIQYFDSPIEHLGLALNEIFSVIIFLENIRHTFLFIFCQLNRVLLIL